MALRVSSKYSTNIVIDGEIIPIHVSRLDPDQALLFNQQFARLGKLGKRAAKAEGDATGAAEPPSPEDEAASKKFVVSAISEYIKVEPGHIFVDESETSVTEGAELCKLFGARDEVLSELLLHIFMENKLNAEQKRTWKTQLAPFVPTPTDVADRMMQMAHVTKDDVVIDLGCGAGALCIAAAKAGATTVIGYDTDEQRITEAKAAAEAAGVADRCRFEQKDALDVDVSQATVVGLYLLAGSNGKLRPVLQSKLPKGARVISHAFTMGGGWVPDATEFVKPPEGGEVAHQGARWIYLYSIDSYRRVTSKGA